MSAFVSPGWLEEHLDDPDVRIIEASIAKATYDAGHIPGAGWVDFHADLLINGDDSSGDVLTPQQFAALMERLGVTPQSTVVWYGDRHSSYATRGYWMMDYYQHRGLYHVLEGGRERWERERRPLTTETPPPPVARYPEPPIFANENRATWKEVRAAIGAPELVLLDVRSPGEYAGTERRARRAGHIPGAIHIEWTDVTTAPNALKPDSELRRMFEDQGVTPDKQIITHCQLGIRAAHTWFVLKHVLGYPHVKNYDGSWQEWGNRDDLPIEC